MILDVLRTGLKMSGDRAFSVLAEKHIAWNSLPFFNLITLRLLPTLCSFKMFILTLVSGNTDSLNYADNDGT